MKDTARVMLQEQAEGTRRVRRRIRLAFLVLALLALTGGGLVVYQLAFGLRRPLGNAHRAQLKAFHTAEIGRHGTAMAAGLYHYALEPLPPDQIADIENRLELIRWHLEELRPLITDEQLMFAAAQPLYQRTWRVAHQALAAGNDESGRRLVRQLTAELTPLLGQARALTDQMIEKSRADAATFLDQSNERMSVALWATIIWTGVFIVLIVVAAVYALRVVRRQHRVITEQMHRLQQAVRDLDDFAGRIAHDLRGPLGPILLAGEHLQRTSDPDVVDRSADRIVRSARRADELIDSLLAFSRAGEARAGGHCDASRAAGQALDETLDAAEDADIELRAMVEPVEVAIEEPLLAQALQNLVGNAIRYMPEDAEQRKVTVWSRIRDGVVDIGVSDTGRGIPPEERKDVFRPFYRRDQDSRTTTGTGLGLATVKRIAEAHHGTVDIADNPGGGAVVWLSIPVAAPGREEAAPGDGATAPGAEPP